MYKWEEGLNALGLELVDDLGGDRVLVKMNGFTFNMQKGKLARGQLPTIISCTDKTGYFKYKFGDVLNKDLDFTLFNYEGSLKKAQVQCNKHGLIEITPHLLSRGTGCRKCSDIERATKLTSDPHTVLRKAMSVHRGKYKYGDISGKSYQKIQITCPEHGKFEQVLSAHLGGRGCEACARELKPIFNRSSMARYPVYNLYVMCIEPKDGLEEVFYKVGITKHVSRRRYEVEKSSRGFYKVRVMWSLSSDGYTCWDLEKVVHKHFKRFGYEPMHYISGSTECFRFINIADLEEICLGALDVSE